MKDKCQFCLGAKGGVLGNENVFAGIIVCDYCTMLVTRILHPKGEPSDREKPEPPEDDPGACGAYFAPPTGRRTYVCVSDKGHAGQHFSSAGSGFAWPPAAAKLEPLGHKFQPGIDDACLHFCGRDRGAHTPSIETKTDLALALAQELRAALLAARQDERRKAVEAMIMALGRDHPIIREWRDDLPADPSPEKETGK